ncbi:hypothetical protein WMY93_018225 [Mugilogobius chulae]|uniref:Uncharacterized protein n=1 Tax=Mugilogobius chulae TaxID=88201 RepID=A0AAW0NV09_9GOBI
MVYIRAIMHTIHDKLSISITHKLGTFLCPHFKSLKMLPLEERNAVYDQARRIAWDFYSPTPSPSASPSVKNHASQPDMNEAAQKKDLQRVVRTAERVVGSSLPDLDSICSMLLLTQASNILQDPTHSGNSFFSTLPSGRLKTPITRTNRLRNIFYPRAVDILQAHRHR